jgi:hypothetical protein
MSGKPVVEAGRVSENRAEGLKEHLLLCLLIFLAKYFIKLDEMRRKRSFELKHTIRF